MDASDVEVRPTGGGLVIVGIRKFAEKKMESEPFVSDEETGLQCAGLFGS